MFSCGLCNCKLIESDFCIQIEYNKKYFICFSCVATLRVPYLLQMIPFSEPGVFIVSCTKIMKDNHFYSIPWWTLHLLEEDHEYAMKKIVQWIDNLKVNQGCNMCRYIGLIKFVKKLLAKYTIRRWLTKCRGYYRIKYWTVRKEFEWHPKSQKLLQLVDSWQDETY